MDWYDVHVTVAEITVVFRIQAYGNMEAVDAMTALFPQASFVWAAKVDSAEAN